MTDRDCTLFLQWALPRLRLRWPGFRKVRGQVCKRLARRIEDLGIPGPRDYRDHLGRHPDEWPVLDSLCRVTISRFFRDHAVFRTLERTVLPALADNARSQGGRTLACWSAGCASGEEPYSLAIIWKLTLRERFPDLGISIVATDVDESLLERARSGCYRPGSLRELPQSWRRQAFEQSQGVLVLREMFREGVRFLCRDLRSGPAGGPFDIVLCRNLAFTYFDEDLQRDVVTMLAGALVPGGALVIGSHEKLPRGGESFEPWRKGSCIYRKIRQVCVGDQVRNDVEPFIP